MPQLKRSLSIWFTIAYGLGTLLGAGIYVLVGKVASYAGLSAPFAFLFSAIAAIFTGISYAELSSRYPKSAGEAAYVREAFSWKWLSGLTGWLVVTTGIVSAATLARGFVGYFQIFAPLSDWLIITLLVVSLGGIAAWGITESVILATVITLLEIGGLLLVIAIASPSFADLPERLFDILPLTTKVEAWSGIFMGAFLAFYAFIGFEDMVNIAEEVKNPRRNLPRAILYSLLVATILYILISLVAILSLPLPELSMSQAPMALLLEQRGFSPYFISLISLIAVINGALVQIIMASRVLYGMTKLQTAPLLFGIIHRKTRTPLIGTLFVTLLVLILALFFPLVGLAETTSYIILLVFALVNGALITVKTKKKNRKDTFSVHLAFPIIGLAFCLFFLFMKTFV